MKTNDFPRMLSDFLLKELPGVRNQSSNTIVSYRDTYIRLLTYCRDILGIRPENLNVADLTAERIAEFLNWLERKCNNSISTRNQRLAAIHSLFRYIQMQAPEHMFQCQQVLGIPYKKTSRRQVGYLSEAETKTLLSMPDTKTRKGRRDQALLTLLYDSGARVQELADLRVGDLRLEFPAQVKLTGKGRKTRSVPLMDKTTALLKNYLLEQHLDSPSDFEHPLFYNSQGRKLTRQGIAYILKKYAVACEIEEISPHKIRHTSVRGCLQGERDFFLPRKSSVRTDAAGCVERPSFCLRRPLHRWLSFHDRYCSGPAVFRFLSEKPVHTGFLCYSHTLLASFSASLAAKWFGPFLSGESVPCRISAPLP